VTKYLLHRPWSALALTAALCLLWPALPGWGQAQEAQKPQPALYDFGMGKCVSCQQMEKILEKVKAKYGEQVTIRMLYPDKEKELFSKYKIVAVPTQVFLDASGKEVERHMGLFPEADLVKKLQELKFIKP
jgi:thioredoxin-like negative regulator of GroEL